MINSGEVSYVVGQKWAKKGNLVSRSGAMGVLCIGDKKQGTVLTVLVLVSYDSMER